MRQTEAIGELSKTTSPEIRRGLCPCEGEKLTNILPMVPMDLERLTGESFCYLTTTGRVTGRPHEIEIWFALFGDTLYMLSGGRDGADWVKNLRRRPQVTVRIAGEHFEGRARVVGDPAEDALARKLLVDKYERDPGSLANWRRTALPVAVDLNVSDHPSVDT